MKPFVVLIKNVPPRIISIYQPQIESFEKNSIEARAALAVKIKDKAPVFGAMWFTSKLDTDFDTRLVSLNDVSIESVKFPDASEEDEDALKTFP